MAQGSVECANCGNANPAWAQVCRSCGAKLSAAAGGAGGTAGATNESAEPFVTEGSLMAIGAALGTILLAVVIGLVIGGILPPAPPVAAASPTPDASASIEPTAQPTPDLSASPGASATEAPPALPGTLSFGLGLNVETQRVINPSDTFTPGTTFAHSIELTSPFGVTQIAEQVSRVSKDGSETVVITAEENPLTVDPNATVDGFTVPTNALLDALGAGTYVMRVYRGSELLAQGTFILVE
jgi:hypothetical protein